MHMQFYMHTLHAHNSYMHASVLLFVVISVQRSSVRDISFRPQLNQYNQTSIHIPSQLLEQKSKDGTYV